MDLSHSDCLRLLAATELNDIVVLDRDTAKRVIQENRLELLHAIASEEPKSIRDHADALDLSPSIVHRHLDVLSNAGIIEFHEWTRAKQPVLACETVILEPILYDGAVLFEDDDRD